MIKVLKSGFHSSIQDQGRFGYRAYGIPLSGAMDSQSMNLANTLLGNAINDAVMEITMLGPSLQFNTTTQIVITGADISPRINDVPITNNKAYTVRNNDVLSFGRLKHGLHAYIALKGGFKTESVFGSKSYYKDITSKHVIEKGDILNIETYDVSAIKENHSKLKSNTFSDNVLSVFKGPEFELLSAEQQQKLLTTEFTVSKLYNRMAYQLEKTIEHSLASILTSPVLPGTVQLTPSGKLIVLMRDCQTTGGYPRVLQLTEVAINLLSQKKFGDVVIFRL